MIRIILLIPLLLGGCTSMQFARQQSGGCLASTLVGAASGGIAGAAIGAGSGQLLAIATGVQLGGISGYIANPACHEVTAPAPIVVKP